MTGRSFFTKSLTVLHYFVTEKTCIDPQPARGADTCTPVFSGTHLLTDCFRAVATTAPQFNAIAPTITVSQMPVTTHTAVTRMTSGIFVGHLEFLVMYAVGSRNPCVQP